MIFRVVDKKGNVLYERKKGGKKPQYVLKYHEYAIIIKKEKKQKGILDKK